MSGSGEPSFSEPELRAMTPRRLLLVTGERGAAVAFCRGRLEFAEATWISTRAPKDAAVIAPPQAASLLGDEREVVIIDGFEGIPADALGIAGGCVPGGGLLVLLLPSIDPADAAFGHSAFMQRLVRMLVDHPAAEIVPAAPNSAIPPPVAPKGRVPAINVGDPTGATEDQRAAVDAVMHVVTGQRRRPVILLADRGRGKSAALGIAAARLLQGGCGRIVVSGRSRDSASRVFEHAKRLACDAARRLEWAPVETLLEAQMPCDLLLVDEAAGVPPADLSRLLARYPRIAMATTVHGYEGSGRGFLLRFGHVLDRLSRGWRRCEMAEPIRWPGGDPVERCLHDLLLLDAEPPPADPATGVDNCEFSVLDPAMLISDEAALRDVFGLLMTAHYRTRPSDLVRLLDDPGQQIHALRTGDREDGRIAGVVLIRQEPRPDQVLGRDILSGKRRPPEHVLAEILGGHAGMAFAVDHDFLRIQRIVVHPELQRRGLGSRMLNALSDSLAGMAVISGTQFSLSPGLVRFWQSCGYRPFHVGTRPSRFAGEVSGLFLLTGPDGTDDHLDAAKRRFTEQFAQSLPRDHRNVSPAVVAALLEGIPEYRQTPSNADLFTCATFCTGRVAESAVIASLARCALWGLAHGTLKEPELVVERILQGRRWMECDALSGEEGLRAGSARLRAAFSGLLASAAPEALAAAGGRLNPPPARD